MTKLGDEQKTHARNQRHTHRRKIHTRTHTRHPKAPKGTYIYNTAHIPKSHSPKHTHTHTHPETERERDSLLIN